MMNALKSARTLAASLGVLAVGALAASPAQAFDKVDWTWTVNKVQNETIDVDVDIDINATGLVQVEKLQIFLGNVRADATVDYVENNPARDGHFVYCYGWVWDPLDAASLPEIKNAASAFGNLQVITSDVPIFLHDGQVVANTDGYGTLCDPETALFGLGLALSGVGGNTHTDLAKVFT